MSASHNNCQDHWTIKEKSCLGSWCWGFIPRWVGPVAVGLWQVITVGCMREQSCTLHVWKVTDRDGVDHVSLSPLKVPSMTWKPPTWPIGNQPFTTWDSGGHPRLSYSTGVAIFHSHKPTVSDLASPHPCPHLLITQVFISVIVMGVCPISLWF